MGERNPTFLGDVDYSYSYSGENQKEASNRVGGRRKKGRGEGNSEGGGRQSSISCVEKKGGCLNFREEVSSHCRNGGKDQVLLGGGHILQIYKKGDKLVCVTKSLRYFLPHP